MSARGERGQGSLETTGIVLLAAILVSGVVGAVASQSDPVRSAVSAGICRIVSQAVECDTDDDETTVAAGPAAQDRSPVCLPSGSTGAGPEQNFRVEVSQEFPELGASVLLRWRDYANGNQGSAGRSGETGFRVVGSAEVGESVPDENGLNWTEVGLDVALEGYAQNGGSLAFNGLRLSGEQEQLAGLGAGMTLTVPEFYLDDGVPTAGLPHPLHPESIPPGGTLTLDAEAYAAAGMQGSFQALVGSLEVQRSEEVSLAVSPLGDDLYQVSFGTTEAIEHAARLGLGIPQANVSLTHDQRIGDFEVQQYTIDLSTVDGQQAYLDLVGGQVPTPETLGVVDSAVVTGNDYALDRGAALQLGGLDVSTRFDSSTTTQSLSENADGTTTVVLSQVTNGQVRTFVEHYDADGALTSRETDVRLTDVPGASASGYNQMFAGSQAEVDGTVNLVLDLDGDDLEQIRQDTLTLTADWLNSDYSGQSMAYQLMPDAGAIVSRQELADWLADASPGDIERLTTALQAGGGDFVTQASTSVLQAMASTDDEDLDWATWAAFTDHVDENGQVAAENFMNWGVRVSEVTGDPYGGFGSATCVSVT